MPQVRVQGFPAGDHQEYAYQRQKAHQVIAREKLHRVPGCHGIEHFRMPDNAVQSQRRQGQKPGHHDWAEHRPYLGGTEFLHGKQYHQNGNCYRQHVFVQRRCCDLQPLHSTEHRDGRRQHGAPIE